MNFLMEQTTLMKCSIYVGIMHFSQYGNGIGLQQIKKKWVYKEIL